MKCGYCLPHCPTYRKTRNEADSPRGRIALIQGWLTGALVMSPVMAQHLDGCLTCRTCETVCPSLVAYGRLADVAKARRVAATSPWRRRPLCLALGLLSNARVTSWLGWFARHYRRSGLAQLAERLRIDRLGKLAIYHRLTVAMGALSRGVAAREPEAARLDLFVGCMGSSAQGGAIAAVIAVCEHLGMPVRIAPEPSCCGALMRHTGFAQEADTYREASARLHVGRPLVGVSSACVAELKDHPTLCDTQEICAFIEQCNWRRTLELRPLVRRILVHEPCSHRNLLGGASAVYALLSKIPGALLAPLPGNDQCCGAAGIYLLQQPAMAKTLLDDKLDALAQARPDIVVTTNPGCALHLASGIREAGLSIEVCHPIELIARQLPKSDSANTGQPTPSA